MKIHQILINDLNKLPTKYPDYYNICYKQIEKIYPDFEYHIYSGEEIEEIIKSNFHEDVYISYKKLKPYACKCDLARYCLLYLYGGLYIDLNNYFNERIPHLDKLDFFAFRDIVKTSKRSWSVSNSIMYAKKQSPIMKKCIDIVVQHCKTEYYGISAIDVSACTVLGKGIMLSDCDHELVSTQGELCWINPEKINDYFYGIAFLLDDGTNICYRKPINHVDNIGNISYLGFEGTNNYIEMWDRNDIYDKNYKFNFTKNIPEHIEKNIKVKMKMKYQ